MDMAFMGTKKLKKQGKLQDLDESDEINACSIKVPVKIDGEDGRMAGQFKNETHNHPTEIEPFGGAATCLGGAIRDPLSGRRPMSIRLCVSPAAADPRRIFEEDAFQESCLQRKITTGRGVRI